MQKPVTEKICYNAKGEVIVCEEEPASTFAYVERMPQSGFDWQAYLSRNLHYPKLAKEAKIEGRVIIKFVVDEDGAIAYPHVIKGIGGGCDEEALRVVSEMPYWQPGMQNGVLVRVYYTLPIVFKLK